MDPSGDLPETSFNYQGQTAIVTGAGRGIGRAIALAFAANGARVHAVARSSAVDETVAIIVDRGGTALGTQGTVVDEELCRDVIARTPPDVIVNAAAILGPEGRFGEFSAAQFAEVLAVNVIGTSNMMSCAIGGMIARGYGRIVNFAGGGAAYAYPGFAPYGVSKAAVVRLTETVAVEVRDDHPGLDVTINVIAPGAVETDMLTEVRRRGGEVRTTVSIDEPVALTLFLSSRAAGGISGRFIHVRDDYRNADLYEQPDMLTLRRVERR